MRIAAAKTPDYAESEITVETITGNPRRYAVVWRQKFLGSVISPPLPKNSCCFYGYWSGYLKNQKGEAFEQELAAANCRLKLAHVGGHIRPKDLFALIRRLRPKEIIAIHTTAGEVLSEGFGMVIPLSNGQGHEI